MRKFLATTLIALVLITQSGCLFRKKGATNNNNAPITTLVFYGLYDSSEIWDPFIRSYETAHPNVQIEYKRFNNEAEYWNLIVNELAEGEGPDIFLMHNTWVPFQTKKLTPAPTEWANPETFGDLFVDIAKKDWIRPDAEGNQKVWGLPLSVDTLSFFYNKDQFEESLPETGKPASTWGAWINEVQNLNRNNGKKLERGAISLGRVDNIQRGYDSFWLWLVQSGAFSKKEGAWTLEPKSAHEQNLDAWRNFANADSPFEAWNETLADKASSEKELTSFAQGKVSTIMGYSYTYSQILNEISRLKSLRIKTIDPLSIETAPIAQLQDRNSENGQPVTLASYYAPVVSRTSAHSDTAWDFLLTMATTENMKAMHQLSHRPSALRSALAQEKDEKIYGTFSEQVGFAETIPNPDPINFKPILEAVIQNALDQNMSTHEMLQNFDETWSSFFK